MNGIRFSEQEKLQHIEAYKNSYLSLQDYAKKYGMSETALKKWLKEQKKFEFGEICLETTVEHVEKDIVFACENIRIELKENFDKNLLKKIVEVLINDK